MNHISTTEFSRRFVTVLPVYKNPIWAIKCEMWSYFEAKFTSTSIAINPADSGFIPVGRVY